MVFGGHSRRPSRYPRARLTSHHIRTFLMQSNRCWSFNVLGARGSGIQRNLVAVAPRFGFQLSEFLLSAFSPVASQRRHLRRSRRPRKRVSSPLRQASALFRPRTTTDSPAFQPLHSSRSSPAFRKKSVCSMPSFHSFVPPAANCRDSQNSSCASPGRARTPSRRARARRGRCAPS